MCRVVAALAHPGDRHRLLGALRGGEPRLRRAAAASRAAHGPEPDIVQALVYALADDAPAVRAASAGSLGAIAPADADAAAALAGACRDPDPATAVAATRALGQLGDPASAPLLRELISAGGATAHACVEALGHLGDPADDGILAEMLALPDPETVKAAARALAERPRPRPRAALLPLLDHRRWDVRRAAVHALAGQAADQDVTSALRARAAVEEDALVAEALATALAGR
jgi:HEAT repeat protein